MSNIPAIKLKPGIPGFCDVSCAESSTFSSDNIPLPSGAALIEDEGTDFFSPVIANGEKTGVSVSKYKYLLSSPILVVGRELHEVLILYRMFSITLMEVT